MDFWSNNFLLLYLENKMNTADLFLSSKISFSLIFYLSLITEHAKYLLLMGEQSTYKLADT